MSESNDVDELIEENGIGVIQSAAISSAGAEEQLRIVLRELGVDLRSSMPQDQNCLEYRLRDALNMVIGSKNELADEAGYDNL